MSDNKTITQENTLNFETEQAKDLQQLLDGTRIIAHVLKLLRITSPTATGAKTYNVSCQKKTKIITFDYLPGGDNLSNYLFTYDAKDMPCYKNAKKRIEAVGFKIEESESVKGNKLVWAITNIKV